MVVLLETGLGRSCRGDRWTSRDVRSAAFPGPSRCVLAVWQRGKAGRRNARERGGRTAPTGGIHRQIRSTVMNTWMMQYVALARARELEEVRRRRDVHLMGRLRVARRR
jgi:hypothetical protein